MLNNYSSKLLATKGHGLIVVILILSILVVLGVTSVPVLKNKLIKDTHAQEKPNIVVIMTDDQDFDSLPVMRKLMSYPEGSWVKFNNAFVSYSLCCPARTSLLTGQFAYIHGVMANGMGKNLDDSNLLPVWLDNVGYQTGLLGKYLSDFPWDRGSGYIPPGWDYFNRQTTNPVEMSNKAATFISQTSENPFFLYLAYRSPHYPARPLPEYSTADVFVAPDSPNFNEADVSDKPNKIKNLPLLTQETIDEWRAERLASQRDLLGVDDGVQIVIDALKAKGKLDNTVIIFMADHGFSWGSHRWIGKVCPYEECSRFPLFIRYPGLGENREENRIVSNVDLTSTIAELTGATVGRSQNGRSLLPVITNTVTDWSEVAFLESPGYFGVRVPGWKYIEYSNGNRELYDLTADPYELQNLQGQANYAAKQSELAAILKPLKGSTSSSSPTPGPSGSPTATPTPKPTATPKPIVNITSISNNSLISGTKNVRVSVQDLEDSLERVEVYVDDNLIGTAPEIATPFNVSWDTRTVTDGSHALTAKAYFMMGGPITSPVINVTVDNTVPTVNVISPVPNSTVSGTIQVSATASDASGIKFVKFFVDGVLKSTLETEPYEYSFDTTTVANGKRNIRVTAADKIGNTNPITIPVFVQN